MLTRIALKFRVITLLILALVIASGVWSASKLQLELLPDVEFPLFTVFTYYEDGAPQDVLDDFRSILLVHYPRLLIFNVCSNLEENVKPWISILIGG